MYSIKIKTPSGQGYATLFHLNKKFVTEELVREFYQTYVPDPNQDKDLVMLNNDWNYDFCDFLINKKGFHRFHMIDKNVRLQNSEIVVLKGDEYVWDELETEVNEWAKEQTND